MEFTVTGEKSRLKRNQEINNLLLIDVLGISDILSFKELCDEQPYAYLLVMSQIIPLGRCKERK